MIGQTLLHALTDVREGRVQLTAEQQLEFLDAVEELARVLIGAPRGGDGAQNAIWYRHERTPALARLADAARPQEPSLARELEAARVEDARIVHQLQAGLGAPSASPPRRR
jgi:hypothetical protein